MIDNQEENTVFTSPLAALPKIEAGEFTYYNDSDDPTLAEARNVLCMAGIGNGATGAAKARSSNASAVHHGGRRPGQNPRPRYPGE